MQRTTKREQKMSSFCQILGEVMTVLEMTEVQTKHEHKDLKGI